MPYSCNNLSVNFPLSYSANPSNACLSCEQRSTLPASSRSLVMLSLLLNAAYHKGVCPELSGRLRSTLPVSTSSRTTRSCPIVAAHENGGMPLPSVFVLHSRNPASSRSLKIDNRPHNAGVIKTSLWSLEFTLALPDSNKSLTIDSCPVSTAPVKAVLPKLFFASGSTPSDSNSSLAVDSCLRLAASSSKRCAVLISRPRSNLGRIRIEVGFDKSIVTDSYGMHQRRPALTVY
jgi:hypothetical protein